MLIKQEFITSQKLGLRDLWQIANSVLNKGKSVIPLLFNSPEVLSSASDKAKLFARNFSKNSNLDDSRIHLPVFFHHIAYDYSCADWNGLCDHLIDVPWEDL